MSPPTPSTTVPPTPDLDLEEDYFPFPALLPLEDIDLPAGPPAILRPGLRIGQQKHLTVGTYLQPFYSRYLLGTFL